MRLDEQLIIAEIARRPTRDSNCQVPEFIGHRKPPLPRSMLAAIEVDLLLTVARTPAGLPAYANGDPAGATISERRQGIHRAGPRFTAQAKPLNQPARRH